MQYPDQVVWVRALAESIGKQGAVVSVLASHQCVPGSIPGPSTICGLSLLLVIYSAPRGFSSGTPVFPSSQKPTCLNSNLTWIIVKHFIMSPWLGRLHKHFLCLMLHSHLQFTFLQASLLRRTRNTPGCFILQKLG